MITRDESIAIVKEHVKNENLVKHMIAVGAIMRGLAVRFGEDQDLWEDVGILHDVDYEEVGQDWTRHGAVSADIVKDLLPEETSRRQGSQSPDRLHTEEQDGLEPICCRWPLRTYNRAGVDDARQEDRLGEGVKPRQKD